MSLAMTIERCVLAFAALVAIPSVFACSGSQQASVVATESSPSTEATHERETAFVIPSAGTTPPAAPPAPSTTADPAIVPSATESALPASATSCTGSSFDLEHLPKSCGMKSGALHATAKAFSATLSTDEKSVRAGEPVSATLTLTNVSNEDQEVVLHPGCEYFELQSFIRGKRADYITDCGHGRGCGYSTVRVVVTPKGTLTRRLHFTADAHHEMRRTNCSDVVTPLATGRYELRVSVENFPLADLVRKARASLDVVR